MHRRNSWDATKRLKGGPVNWIIIFGPPIRSAERTRFKEFLLDPHGFRH